MAAYATGADLIARYDVNLVGDLASDGGEQVDPALVANLPMVATALLDASGEVEIALLAGGRYQVSDLASLTGNTQNKLIRIVCDIAMALLIQRRADERYREQATQIATIARDHLAKLSRGENVFGIQAATDAGLIEMATVSALAIDNRNNLPSRMSRYFPVTETMIPGQPY